MRIRGGSKTSAAIVLLLAGCTSQLSPSPSPAAPSPTEPSSTVSAASPTAGPTTPPTERELSDRFWGTVTNYGLYHDFHSLEEITADSDLIVRGRIAGKTTTSCSANASPRPGVPDPCEGRLLAFAIIAVDAVLKSDGRDNSGTVMVQLSGIITFPEPDLPRGELVLFLKNYGQFYTDEVAPEPSDSPRWGSYYINTSYQSALRNLDGVVDVPEAPEGWWDTFGPFPSDIDAQPFDVVVTRIRELVAS